MQSVFPFNFRCHVILGLLILSNAPSLLGAFRSVRGENISFDAGSNDHNEATITQDGFLGVGTSDPESTLTIKGSLGIIPQTISSNTTLSNNTLIFASSSSGNIDIILPMANQFEGRMYQIKKITRINEVHLISSGYDYIDDTYKKIILKQDENNYHLLPELSVHSDGETWRIVSSSFQSAPSGHRILADYPMDQLSSEAHVIDSVGGHHGTTDASWDLSGNTSILLNGSNAVNIGQPSELKFTPDTDSFTISAWFNLNGETMATLVSCAGSEVNNRRYHMYVFGGDVSGRVGGAAISHQTNINDSDWHHMALVNDMDANTMKFKIYLDGVESSTSGISGSNIPTNPLDILFGARRSDATDLNSGTAFSYANKLDKVRFYNYALNSSEIQDLYHHQKNN